MSRVIESGKYWENELTETIIGVLSHINTSECLVLDIGANMGLVTLSLVSAFPFVKVCAFEPGPFQGRLLQKTILVNNLSDRVQVCDLALGNIKGKTSFTTHFGIDASGLDGFYDTGAGGLASKTIVKVDKLDN